MSTKRAIIVKSANSPASTEVLWQDLNSNPPQLKSFVNGSWVLLNSESTEVTDLREELNTIIDNVNSTLDSKIDTNVETLHNNIQTTLLDLNSTKNRVTALEDTYEDTMNIANLLINELIDGKAQIAQALTDRGYPTESTESSVSIALKIKDMSYGAGWLAQLGYSEENDGGVKQAVEYAKKIKDGWNPDDTTRTFLNDIHLTVVPDLDLSKRSSFQDLFKNCAGLAFCCIDFTKYQPTSIGGIFDSCRALNTIPKMDLSKCTNAYRAYTYCPAQYLPKMNTSICTDLRISAGNILYIEDIDIGAARDCGLGLDAQYAIIRNIGKPDVIVFWDLPKAWGKGSDENFQSLQKSIADLSYDRIAAGKDPVNIKLYAETFERLTEETIAKATSKGLTLVSV